MQEIGEPFGGPTAFSSRCIIGPGWWCGNNDVWSTHRYRLRRLSLRRCNSRSGLGQGPFSSIRSSRAVSFLVRSHYEWLRVLGA